MASSGADQAGTPDRPSLNSSPASVGGMAGGTAFAQAAMQSSNLSIWSSDSAVSPLSKGRAAKPEVAESPSFSAGGTSLQGMLAEGRQPVPYFKLLCMADALDWLLMVVGTIGAVANGVAWPIFAMIFAGFLDTFGMPGKRTSEFMDDVVTIALRFVYLAAASAVAAWLQTSCWVWAGQRQATRIRQRYLQAVLNQDIAYFDTQASSGSFLQVLNNDISTVQAAISDKAAWFIQHLCTLVAGLVVAFFAGWDLALVMCGTMPFMAALGVALARMMSRMSKKVLLAYSDAANITKETLSQIRTVTAYNGQKHALDQYAEALVQPTKTGVLQALVTGVSLGGFNAIVCWSIAVALFYGVWRVSEGQYKGGAIQQVGTAILLGGFSAGQVASVTMVLAKGRASGAKVFDVIEQAPAIDINGGQSRTLGEDMQGSLEFLDVSFAYPARPDIPVLTRFNLVVPGGKTLALVGSSGSGKSTIVQLIERFYDPVQGFVLLDGVDIRTLNLRWLRDQIGLVSQEPTLFAASIYENIAMSRQGATAEEVRAAAKAANAHKFISHLPDGYRTQVGEFGLQMSGGQKQRIAIARAILKDPKILLLDEATSSLDTQNERLVQAALESASVGRTTVVVAHRLSTIRNADTIAVIRQGSVVEQGKHDELINRPRGAYSALVALQMKAERLPNVKDKFKRVSHGLETIGSNSKNSLNVLVEQPACGDAHPEPGSGSFYRLLQLNKPEWGYGLLGVLACCVTGPHQAAFAITLSNFLIIMYEPKDVIKSQSPFWGGMFVWLGGTILLGYTAQLFCFGKMGSELGRRVRCLLFGSILHQEMAFFDRDEHTSGVLTSKLSADASYVRGAVGDLVAVVAQNAFALIAGLVVAFIYSWRIALVVIGALPFMLMGYYLYYQAISQSTTDNAANLGTATQVASEAFSSIRVIQAFNLQDTISDVYSGLSDEAKQAGKRLCIVRGALMGYSQFALFAVYGLIVWYGGYEVSLGRASFGDYLKSFFAIMLSCIGMAQTQMVFPDMGKAKAAIQSIF